MFVQDKVALITGGLSGFGLCFVKEFLKNGVRGITIADVNTDKAKETIDWIDNKYGPNKAIFVKLDVANRTEFEEAFEQTITTFNNLDIVINNAGILNERDPKRTVDVNLIGVINCTLLAMEDYLPKYKSSPDPVIVNVSSLYGLDGCACSPSYTAAKHGVVGLGKSLSAPAHYEATGVQILTICPGHSVTAITNDALEKMPVGRYQDMLKDLIANLYQQQPEVLSRALVKILEDFQTGDVWLVEDDKCYNLEIPHRFSLKKIKTLEV